MDKLRENKAAISKMGVSKLGLYGSYVREQAKEGSDIDILIDFNPKDETFDNFMDAYDSLEELFPSFETSIVTYNGLSKFIGPYILKEVEYV